MIVLYHKKGDIARFVRIKVGSAPNLAYQHGILTEHIINGEVKYLRFLKQSKEFG